MDWLFALLVAFCLTTVVGHGIWALLAFILRTLFGESEPDRNRVVSCLHCGRLMKVDQCRCEHCGQQRSGCKTLELADLAAVERQLQRWRERGELKPRLVERLLTRVESYRRKLQQPGSISRLAAAPGDAAPAEQQEHAATALARRRHLEPPRANKGGLAERAPIKPFAELPAARSNAARQVPEQGSSTASPIAPAIVPEPKAAPKAAPIHKPATPSPLPPAEPRRSFGEMLAAFMEQRNIRWGELVGGLLIVCSSIALVISLWDALNAIPYFQFFIFVGVTAAVFGAGLYTEHRWKLESTSRGILIIATLLVPLNFVAMAATARGGWDWLALMAEFLSLGAFVALVERAARVLVPRWRWQFTLAVVGNSGLLLLERHQLSPIWLAGAGLLVAACHGVSIATALASLRRERSELSPGDGASSKSDAMQFGAESAGELFVLVGASSFALAAAFGLFFARSADRSAAMNWLSPLVALAALPVCATGIAVMRGLKEARELEGWRTAGTAVTLVGMLGMAAAHAFAWPQPAATLAVGLLNFAALAAIALRCRLPVAHAAALVSLAAVYVTGVHLALGHFAGVPRELLGRMTFSLVLDQQTGASLIGLFGLLTIASEVLARRGRPIDARYYAGGCVATAAVSLANVMAHAYLGGDARDRLVLGTCSFYGISGLLLNLRWRQPPLSYLASALLAVGLVDAGWLRPAVPLACPWMAVSLAHATMVLTLGLVCGRFFRHAASDFRHCVVEPLLHSASISSLASLASLPWIGDQPPFALSMHCGWLAALWLAMAIVRRSKGWFAGFQLALTAAVLAATTSWLDEQPWVDGRTIALPDPRSLQTYGIALSLLCAGWSAIGIVLRRVPGAGVLLEDRAVNVDRCTFYLLSLSSFALAAWSILPGVVAELFVGGAAVGTKNIAFGSLAWSLVAAQIFALLAALWHRWRWQETACSVLLVVTAAVLVAGAFAGATAAASALRWSLSVAFLACSACVWLRTPLARMAHKLGCRCQTNERDSLLAQGLLLSLGAAAVLLVTGAVVAMQLGGLRPASPSAGSWFATTASHLVPLAVVAATLLGYAVRETSPGYAFAAGLVTNLTIGGGYALSVRQFGATECATLLQLSTVVASLWAIGWLASARKLFAINGRQEPLHARTLLGVQIGQGLLGNMLLILPAVGMLALFSPRAFDEARHWISAAGSPLGWAAFLLATWAGCLGSWQQGRRVRHESIGVVGLAALGLGACSVAWAGAEEVWTYRALMLGWAFYSLSVVAAAWRATNFFATAETPALPELLVRSAALWVRLAGLLAVAMGIKTAIFHRDEQLWAAAAIALASSACAAMAVWRRREGWAFVAGLGVNLAASIVVWHWQFAERFHFADAWLLLVQANLIAGAAVALVWLAAHERMYADRLFSISGSPLLCLQIALLALGNFVAIGVPLAAVISEPGEISASLLQAGGRGGWLAWLLGAAAVARYCHQVARREVPYALATFLLGLGVLASGGVAARSAEPWGAYHVLLLAWAASGLVLLASSLLVAPRFDWLKSLARAETAVALLTTIETLVAALALRGAWEGPQPYWSVVATLSAGLLAAIVAIAYRRPDHKYVSAALVHLAVVWAGMAAEDSLLVELWLIHLIGLGLQAACWAMLDRRLDIAQAADSRGELPPFAAAAASLATGLFCLTVACNLLRAAGLVPAGKGAMAPFDFAVSPDAPLARLVDPLAWTAWGASAAAMVALLRDGRTRHGLPGLYTIGLAGMALAVERSTASPLRLAQGLSLALAGYLLCVALLETFSRKSKSLSAASPHWLQSDSNWLSPSQFILGLLSVGLSLWVVLDSSLPVDRLAGSVSAAMLFAAAFLETRRIERSWGGRWRLTTLAFAVIAAAEIGCTWHEGEGAIFWLQRQIMLAVMLFLATLAGQFALPKLNRDSRDWIESARRASIAFAGLLLPLLAAILTQEWVLHVPKVGVPMGLAAFAAMAVILAGAAVSATVYAVSPERDPLRPSLRGRTVYVYAAELLALLVVVHFRTAMPKLIPISFLDKYWTLIVMLIAFAGAGLSEFFQRRRLSVLSQPLARTALFAPLIPVFGHWLLPARYIDAEAVLFLVAAFYGLQATLKRSWSLGCLAVASGNAALWLLWHRLRIDFFHHPQLWLIPIALVVLVAEHIQRNRMHPQQSGAVRYFALAVIYVSSTVDVFMSHVGRDLSLPLVLVLMGLSVAGVLAGIMLRVRSFLYLGVSFLLVDLSIMIHHAAWDCGHTWVFWLSGIAAGAAIIALFAVFEKRRNDLTLALDRFNQWS